MGKVGAYSAAVAIGVLRITAHQHYPSDVMIGGTLVVGEQINRP
jgi:membrane-associated phospholipid phosphatase